MVETLVLDLPFHGRWLARNSPARRVPSHGSHLFGTTYAIDFVAVDATGRSAPWSWRSAFWREDPRGFAGFGAPVLAPARGRVVAVHDGEDDHEARRSQLTLVGYQLTQGRRSRLGAPGLAGNHVVIALGTTGPNVMVAHLRRGSVRVGLGDLVEVGEQIGECGNSGNSTQPHVHVQVTDSIDWASCRGLPMSFRNPDNEPWMPRESEVFEC